MNKPLKITKIGNSAGNILPKEVLARFGRKVGDTLTMTDTPDGIQLVAADPEFDRQIMAAREVMMRRRHTLKELAK